MPKGFKSVYCQNKECSKKGVPQLIHAAAKTCPTCKSPVTASRS